MKHKMKLLFVLVIIAIVAVGCTEDIENNGDNNIGVEDDLDNVNVPDVDEGEPIATVNGEVIGRAAFDQMLENYKMQYEQQGFEFDSEEGQQNLAMLEDDILNSLIYEELIYQEAQRSGFEGSDEEAQNEVEMLKAGYESEEEFEQILVLNGLTEEELKDMFKKETMMMEYIQSQMGEITVDEEDVEDYYNEILAMYEEYNATLEEPIEVPEFDEVKAELEMELREEKESQRYMELMDELMESNDVEILL
ncbi:SurA-like protein [Natranaerovirga hydrolytica]|uniref:SurA-like protein n=1 Tax=Natranaerovirga hydrolytica TaxID=680378 RepID=A0A4R1N1H9_9FIRM|nr:SurA N-terminal domain-containing protein [Natranaerovirga hydrolytica]TCK98810.1 SurA-like protein [Natranaerovirga hydrolytica]